ncbi:addiction module protein [Methylovulum miyakonense]|uniref:addiction module protein n=1 Tax=Methylovulum miyakonense TaxID=645578 RepID=UPI00036ACBDC|nr:addiction module protein [Methylovulum miyakonense]
MNIKSSQNTTCLKVDPPLTKPQQEELDRRLEDYLANPNDVLSWQEVKIAAIQELKSC